MNAFKILRSPVLWGLLMILGGGALLADTLLGWDLGDYFWGTAALVGALVFLAEFIGKGKSAWWALIPGITLLGAAGSILSEALLPGAAGWLSGMVFLGAIGLAFFLVYLVDRNQWWAIIPGGVLGTLAVVQVFEEASLRRIDAGSIFFIGLGVTFLLVGLLPTPQGKMSWAFIPGGILLVLGLLLLASRADLMVIVGPAALILVGLALVVRAFWKPRA